MNNVTDRQCGSIHALRPFVFNSSRNTSENEINKICHKYNLNLKTAALKFPYLNNNIATVLTGITSKEQVIENLKSYSSNISSDLWDALEQKNLIKTKVY